MLMRHSCRLTGNYGALEAGSAGDALQDLTGGMIEKNEMSKMSQEELRDIFDTMSKYQSRASLMSASISVSFCFNCANAFAFTLIIRNTRSMFYYK